MTNEELVYLHQHGDRQALEKLTEQNKGLIYKIANRCYTSKTNSIDKEDLIQEGYIGLIVAADKYKFDIEKPCKFSSYAVYWIFQKMNRFIRQKNTNDETSLNVPVGEDESHEIIDYIEGVDYSFENVEERIYIQQLHEELDQVMFKCNTLAERELIKMHYGWDNTKCLTLEDIAEVLDITWSKVKSKKQIAIDKIRNSMWARKKYKEIFEKEKLKKQESSYDSVDKRIDYLEHEKKSIELDKWCKEQLKRMGLTGDILKDRLNIER